MSLVCPNCSFRRSAEAGVRLETCPKCGLEGEEVYLVPPGKPAPQRRFDLVGLMSLARGELARVRAAQDD